MLLTLLLIIGLPGIVSAAGSSDMIKMQKPAGWIIGKEPQLPEQLPDDAIEGGVYYLLSDNQIRVAGGEKTVYFSHFAELIVNQQGLERSSQINVEFDPAYESLVFNSLQIRRDNKIVNKLSSAKISVIQRETELDNLIYDGRLTANVILDDVRVGDIVEYSYTLKGDNPVYKGLFAYRRYIEWTVPLHHQVIRVLWGKNNPLYVTKLNTDADVMERAFDSFREYVVEVNDGVPKYINSETPGWYNPFGIIFFSETNDWSHVASWALPLYEKAIGVSADVAAIADTIRLSHADPEEQIVEALKFVQSEVRYLGIEVGVNSHKPAPAGQTLQRRYGDCKDKAVLFVSLLKYLGIEAAPVLVNSKITGQLADYPPMVNAFNHVMVKVRHDDNVFWLDPTRQYQKGLLADIYQPDYRYALVVEKGSGALERMNERAGSSQLIVKDSFDLTKGAGKEVSFESRSEHIGYEAEAQRYQVARYGLSGLQKKYLEFYRDYYSAVESVDKIRIRDDELTGRLFLEEKYLMKEFWETNNKDRNFKASFLANSIRPYLSKPDQESRSSPYSMSYPKHVKQTIDVIFGSDEWAFEKEEFIEDNPYFFYKFNARYDKSKGTLSLNYEIKLRTDSIAAQDLDKYMAARKRVWESTEYPIVKYFDSAAAEDDGEENNFGLWVLIALIVFYAGGALYVLINWFIDARNQPVYKDTVFYPVSLVKLIALSIVTFGVYTVYWFYRNWLYVKKIDSSSIMPIARGIFSILWFYPFYLRLVEDSCLRYEENKVLVKSMAILFAVTYFIATFLSDVDYLFLPAMVVTALLLLPLANYINYVNTDDSRAYTYNSRWLLRHTVLCLLFIPLIIFIYGSELNILPSEKVVKGSRIWGHHIKYMKRKGVFPADENPVLFYSDALLFIRNDGNGFTDKQVFSYWVDEKKRFNVESEDLSNVKDINVAYAKGWDEDTTITVVREDDSSFVLYVSQIDGGDKHFVNALMKRWKKLRADSPGDR
ncbi:MAG: DUF3857 domain-containing protein [Deltaproteobacteria bacterium]|nr:DUF3857 domain-containing protein [Deltaproteobacteria bacterium]